MADIAVIAHRRGIALQRMADAVGRLARSQKVTAYRPATDHDAAFDPAFRQMLDTERLADFLDALSAKLGCPAPKAKEPPKPAEPAKPEPKVETLAERRQREFDEERRARDAEHEAIPAQAWPKHAMSTQPPPGVEPKKDDEPRQQQ